MIFQELSLKKLSFLVFLPIFFLLSAPGFVQENSLPGFSTGSSGQQLGILEKVNLLVLCTVDEGQKRTFYYYRQDLQPCRPLDVKGYVTGVLVLCNDEVATGIDGMPMDRIRQNRDGTLTCKDFGAIPCKSTIFPYIEAAAHKRGPTGAGADTGAAAYLFGGYSYFPKVLGTGVSGQDHFDISLKIGDASIQIPVRQQGCRTVFTFRPENGREIAFQYQGASLSAHFTAKGDLQRRLTAIAEGIQAVEKKFGLRLATQVNLVDYTEVHNAVTCEGENQIWFYIEILKNEPLGELKTMGEHETLHLLVNRLGLADDSELREHFADLKGFDAFSRERFLLMIRGVLPQEEEHGPGKKAFFFAFINEKNFLEGMKGGHSQQNPDEFCASFLHSLMFVDRLRANLDRPLHLTGRQQPYSLTPKEKQQVAHEYLKTLDILQKAVSPEKAPGLQAGHVRSILAHIHMQAERQVPKPSGRADDSRS